MRYSCKHKNNPTFPFNKTKCKKTEKQDVSSSSEATFFSSFLSPIENLLGRKIEFDDILLLGIIYIIFTEKNKENNTLLLCLLFILLG